MVFCRSSLHIAWVPVFQAAIIRPPSFPVSLVISYIFKTCITANTGQDCPGRPPTIHPLLGLIVGKSHLASSGSRGSPRQTRGLASCLASCFDGGSPHQSKVSRAPRRDAFRGIPDYFWEAPYLFQLGHLQSLPSLSIFGNPTVFPYIFGIAPLN
jgi:hypothetical protein